jgi:protoporphyrinogen oxidase
MIPNDDPDDEPMMMEQSVPEERKGRSKSRSKSPVTRANNADALRRAMNERYLDNAFDALMIGIHNYDIHEVSRRRGTPSIA